LRIVSTVLAKQTTDTHKTMKLIKAFRAFKKTTAYARPGLYAFEAAYTCPRSGGREFRPIQDVPEDITEFIIDVYELSGPVGDRERDWIHSFDAKWDGTALVARQIGR
jgi:hypothetical protein